jgi:WD40 repeat protein
VAQKQVKHVATFHGHVDAARAVAFSPDGKLVASGSDDQSILIWDLAQGKLRAVLEGHHCSVWNLGFSPDSKMLASGIGQPSANRESGWDFTIKLWDVNTGKLVRDLEGCSSNVFSMAFSPDGKYLAACHNGTYDNVKLWDVASGKMLGSPARGDHGASLAFSHDGKLLAVAGKDKAVKLWEVSTREREVLLRLSHDVTGGVNFSPDDKLLAVGTTRSVTMCEVATGKEIRRFKEAVFSPKQVLFSPDGRYLVAVASDWYSVSMWDVQTGEERVRFKPAPLESSSLGADGIAFSRDGSLIAAANRDFVVTVWRNPLSKLPPAAVKSGTRK